MMTQELKEDKQKETDKPKGFRTFFAFCVMKVELNSIAKLLLEKGYSINKAFKESFKVGNYKQLFQLLNTMDAEAVKNAVNMKDEEGRTIFHALAKAPKDSPFSEIIQTLMTTYNLSCQVRDNFGNTPILLACQEGKFELVKALELIGCSVEDTNDKNENCIHMLIRGKNIKKHNRELLKYLIRKGVDYNIQYEEASYSTENPEEVYKCTPLIHLIRTDLFEVWDKGDLLDDVFNQNKLRIDPNQSDSDGKDIFMHFAILNDFDLCKYMIT